MAVDSITHFTLTTKDITEWSMKRFTLYLLFLSVHRNHSNKAQINPVFSEMTQEITFRFDLLLCSIPPFPLCQSSVKMIWEKWITFLTLVLVNAMWVEVEVITIWIPGSSFALLSWGRICMQFLRIKIPQWVLGRSLKFVEVLCVTFEWQTCINNVMMDRMRC